VTVSNPLCGWSGNPAGAETARDLDEARINSMGMEHAMQAKPIQKRTESKAHRRTRRGLGTDRSTSAQTCTHKQRVPPQSAKRNQETQASLTVLLALPGHGYTWQARTRLTCRRCGGRRRRRPRAAAAPETCAPPAGASPLPPRARTDPPSCCCCCSNPLGSSNRRPPTRVPCGQVRRRWLRRCLCRLFLYRGAAAAAREPASIPLRPEVKSDSSPRSFSRPRSPPLCAREYIKQKKNTPWAHRIASPPHVLALDGFGAVPPVTLTPRARKPVPFDPSPSVRDAAGAYVRIVAASHQQACARWRGDRSGLIPRC
jgi:hypothetical protein